MSVTYGELLSNVCKQMYGHSDWEYVDKKLLKRFDDEHYEVILFHYEDTREEE